jgi:hypothetical protein
MRMAELDQGMQDALLAEDMDRFDRLAAESQRREEVRDRNRERAAQRRAERDARRAEEFDAALNAGVDEEAAVEDIYGVPVDRQRRDRAIAELRANGYTGAGFDALARASFRDHVYAQILAAEGSQDVGSEMVTPEGRVRGIDGRSLFVGSENRAYRWASDELKEWWENNPRPDFGEYREQLLAK